VKKGTILVRQGMTNNNRETPLRRLPTRAVGGQFKNSRNLISTILLNAVNQNDQNPKSPEQNLHHDHLHCKCLQTITPTIKLLVDSGADINFIKVSSLRDEILVNEPTEQNLTGITGHTLQSLGTTKLTLCLGQNERTTEFHVAPSSLPVPYDGILGKPFIIGLGTSLNYKTKQLILTDNQPQINSNNFSEHSETRDLSEHLQKLDSIGDLDTSEHSETRDLSENLQSENLLITLQPRSETIVSIPTPHFQEKETLIVPAQTLDESILCSNTVNQVRQKHILIAAVNPTEHPVQLTEKQIKELRFEKYTEVKVQSVRKDTNSNKISGRLATLREELSTDHLNA